MDFNREIMEQKNHGIYIPLDKNKLPKLYLAYKTSLSKVSGRALNDIKVRYERGDPEVIAILNRIAELAEEGKAAIENGDEATLNRLINENFDNRKKIMTISESNQEMIDVARECGASAKFAGSGGSIIGIYKDDAMLNRLIVNLKKINARVIKPYIV
ncbi:MAG TPA: GHMP kinase, partial [Candidatus Marinimicrobia bacterium]|nr:GHMP kinase [Candidatus Neomarinimicrobiota bacterium]